MLFSSLERTKKAFIPQELVFTPEGVFAPSHALLTHLKVPVNTCGSVRAHELQRLLKTFSDPSGVEVTFNKTSVALVNGGTKVRLALTPFDADNIRKPCAKDFEAQHEVVLTEEFMGALKLALTATKLRYVNNGFLAGVHLYRMSDESIILVGTDGKALAGAQVHCDHMPAEYLLLPIGFCRQLVALTALESEQSTLAWNDDFLLARGSETNPCEIIAGRLDTRNKDLLKEADVLGLTSKVFDSLGSGVLVDIPEEFGVSLQRLGALRHRGGDLECEISVENYELILCANNGKSEVVETFRSKVEATAMQSLMVDIEALKSPMDDFQLLGLLDWAVAYTSEDFNKFYVISARKVN